MVLKRVFDYVKFIKDSDNVIVDGVVCKSIRGKHSIWIPELNMKFPFHWNGHFVEYKDAPKGQHWNRIIQSKFGTEDTALADSLFSVAQEYCILNEFYSMGYSPKVDGFFYIKNLITDFRYGADHCDAQGAYGFFMDDATKLRQKEFDKDAFIKDFIESGFLQCSDSALNDLCLEERNNHVNGYVIDIRRSVQDAIHLRDAVIRDQIRKDVSNILYSEKKELLQHNIKELTQFPYKERKENYQSYWLDNEYVKGSRDIGYRFGLFGIPTVLTGASVLDLGCNLGGMAQECYRRGATKVTGIDYENDYVKCAKDLVRYNQQQINFMQFNLKDKGRIEEYVNAYYDEPIDIVFCLAIDKHVGLDRVLEILDNIKFKTLYWEGSFAKDKNTPHVINTQRKLFKRYDVECLGCSGDRNKRYIWRAVNDRY